MDDMLCAGDPDVPHPPMGRTLTRFSQHFRDVGEPTIAGGMSPADRQAWSERACGIACLRTIADHHRLAVPSQEKLLTVAIALQAFTDRGIVHSKLVDVASTLGLSGAAVAVEQVEALFELGAHGFPSIVSVTHLLPMDGRRGGHLMVADRLAGQGEEVRFVDPSRWGRRHHQVGLERFRASYSGRAVLFWPGAHVGAPAPVRRLMTKEH